MGDQVTRDPTHLGRRSAATLDESSGVVDQRFDDLRLRHRLDDFALDDDLSLAVAGGHTEVYFPSPLPDR